MDMNYPDRLMGLVRAGAQAYQVRLKHEPNLFQDNAYVLTRVSPVEIPLTLMLNPDKVIVVQCVGYKQPKRHFWFGYISYFGDDEDSILREGDYLTVEPIDSHSDKVFVVWSKKGEIRLRLKVIPPNIR